MTRIKIIDRSYGLQGTARSLGIGLGENDIASIDKKFLMQSIRRTVFNAAPCTARALRSIVMAALGPLVDDPNWLKMQIEDSLNDLVALGDLLEMSTNINGRRDIILRPAPPAFIAKRDGSFLILGVAGDEITPACEHYILHHSSGLRSLRATNIQAFRNELIDLGLIELPESLWLYAPASTSAAEFTEAWRMRLPVESRPEKVEELQILEAASSKYFYKDRWVALNKNHTGIFVARRPQLYGAKLWCLVDVKAGVVHRLIDIHAEDSRSRECDEAWRLQAAFDALARAPQKVHVVAKGSITILSFFAPIPIWAVRRLNFIGIQVNLPSSLFSFELPTDYVHDEIRWLEEHLWLTSNAEEGFS